MSDKVNLSQNLLMKLLTGRASRNIQGWYLIFYLGIYFSLLIICFSTYSGSYSIFTNFISDLGMPARNPSTWWLFSIAMIWNGIMFYPQYRYMYYHQARDFKIMNIIAVTLGYVASIGSIIIGLFPQDFSTETSNIPHLLGVFIQFGGVYSSILFNFIIILHKKRKKHSWPRKWSFIFYYIQAYFAVIIYYYNYELHTLFTPFGIPSVLFSVYFWEWIVMFSVIIWILGLFHITGER